MTGVSMARFMEIRRFALMLPDVQRVALANRLIAGVTDGACALHLARLECHAGEVLRDVRGRRVMEACLERTTTFEAIAGAAFSLSEAQRVVLANYLIARVTDGACALQLARLERHAGEVLRDLSRRAMLEGGN